MKYFERYSGGEKDIDDAFDLLKETIKKFLLQDSEILVLQRIRRLFPENLEELLEKIKRALFENDNCEFILTVENELLEILGKIKELARKENVPIYLGSDLAKSESSQDLDFLLLSKIINLLHFSLEKIKALLGYKRFQIQTTKLKSN